MQIFSVVGFSLLGIVTPLIVQVLSGQGDVRFGEDAKWFFGVAFGLIAVGHFYS